MAAFKSKAEERRAKKWHMADKPVERPSGGDGYGALCDYLLHPERQAERDANLAAAHDAVVKAAKAWWKNRRPCAWDEAEHLDNPTINTTCEAEKILASACAALAKLEGDK